MIYPSLDHALRLHEMVISSTGGASGIRDQGLLESAVARPLAAYAEVELYPTLWEKAGALTHGVMRNHPFLDGNKRTAMVIGVTFLLMNGFFLDVSQDEFESTALATAEGKLGPGDLARWFAENCKAGT